MKWSLLILCLSLPLPASPASEALATDDEGRVLASDFWSADLYSSLPRQGDYFLPGERGTLVDGELQGNLFQSYDNGRPKIQAHFEEGFLDGPLRAYFPNGALSQEATFRNGLKQDVEVTYHANGRFRSRVRYRNGVAQSNAQYFDLEGRLIPLEVSTIANLACTF